ncbi:MAG: PDZ domain-containing protein [Flavobacteriales bacterium]
MNRTVPYVSLLALLACAPSCPLRAQEAEAPKAKIHISVTEDGETKQMEREIPLNDPGALEQALREMGIMDEMNIDDGANRIEINIRKRGDEGVLKDMDMSMFMETPGAMVWAPSEPRAYLGVYTGNWNQSTCDDDKKKNKNNTSVKEGACVSYVVEGTAAEKAGLKEGDVIVAIDDAEVKSEAHLVEAIRNHKPGDPVKVIYWRDGKKNTVGADLGETDATEGYGYSYNYDGDGSGNSYVFDMGGAFLGVVPGATVDGGLSVEDVVDGSSAEGMGLLDGDVIKSLNGHDIEDFDDLVEAVEKTEPEQDVTLKVQREGNPLELKGKMGRSEAFTFEMPEMAPMSPMPPVPPMNGMDRMSDADQEQYKRDMEQYERDMEQHGRDMEQHDRDMEQHDRGMEQHDRDLEQQRNDMEQLRQEMEELRNELRGDVRREMRVTIERKELTSEETTLLRNKGVAGLDNKLDLAGLRCFPNPSEGFFRLQFNVPAKGDLNVDVHDAKGERVYHESISDYEGDYERTLNLSTKADGNYYLVITQNGRTCTQKLVKE